MQGDPNVPLSGQPNFSFHGWAGLNRGTTETKFSYKSELPQFRYHLCYLAIWPQASHSISASALQPKYGNNNNTHTNLTPLLLKGIIDYGMLCKLQKVLYKCTVGSMQNFIWFLILKSRSRLLYKNQCFSTVSTCQFRYKSP